MYIYIYMITSKKTQSRRGWVLIHPKKQKDTIITDVKVLAVTES